jgi:hypothetical protein
MRLWIEHPMSRGRDRTKPSEVAAMRRLKVLLVLGIICALFSGLATPVSAGEAPSVRFWTWHDKLSDGWPNPWTGSDGPAITSYLWDSPWEWSYGAPSYILFQLSNSSVTAQQVMAGGTILSRGYLPADMKLTLPGDGEYAVVLLPPATASPNGTPWRVSSDELQFISVYQGQVNVRQALSGRWTGDQALVGIINSMPDPCHPAIYLNGIAGGWNYIGGSGFTPDNLFEVYVALASAPDSFQNVVSFPTTPNGTIDLQVMNTMSIIIYARDLGCGQDSNVLALEPTVPGQ